MGRLLCTVFVKKHHEFFADAIVVSHYLYSIIALRRVKQQIFSIVLYCMNVFVHTRSQCCVAL